MDITKQLSGGDRRSIGNVDKVELLSKLNQQSPTVHDDPGK